VRFCLRCAAEAQVTFPRSARCERYGYRAIFSREPVVAAIPRDEDGRIWLLRRTLHEGAGRWIVPDTPHETAEASEVRAFAPADLPWDEMAFWSTKQALRDALA